ncbi:hypothetical protein R3W88_031733 [Solanum pinnatisectum]|uniref:C3H1-type domain-containing protein n=1 Tax=Solanum pinnatisectum TaxID=50273 RepID=A0AAV9LM62_9SOLN|nr:hypothetical protein R3W88_031733 [Solanum pinnatisectum]
MDGLAMRCYFFARGWCIKGNSTRFHHTEQHLTSHETRKIPHDKGDGSFFGHSDILPEKDMPSDDTIVTHQESMNTSSKEDKHLEFEWFTSRNEFDIDNKCVNKELTILKNFCAALVEFVKELLRQTWNEVENSLHPNQIPNTAESTEEYFDLSLPKLTKIIEVRHKKSVCPCELCLSLI